MMHHQLSLGFFSAAAHIFDACCLLLPVIVLVSLYNVQHIESIFGPKQHYGQWIPKVPRQLRLVNTTQSSNRSNIRIMLTMQCQLRVHVLPSSHGLHNTIAGQERRYSLILQNPGLHSVMLFFYFTSNATVFKILTFYCISTWQRPWIACLWQNTSSDLRLKVTHVTPPSTTLTCPLLHVKSTLLPAFTAEHWHRTSSNDEDCAIWLKAAEQARK